LKRIINHPILGREEEKNMVKISVDGKEIWAREGEMIAATLLANGIRIHRYTVKNREARGIFCGIGQCTDCVMVVNGKPNIRTCVTPVKAGMIVETQHGVGKRGIKDD
jgi:predicted molibdopterin-dependent oxidoreductase YjgC